MDGIYHQNIATDSRVIKAALALATRAHEGQPRNKKDASIPYIVHPVMVYHLLKEYGETNEITLSAALLHDVKEDCEHYRNDPKAFIDDLEALLIAEHVHDHEQIAGYIARVCDHLTNPDKREMIGGKRMWQVEHAAHLSVREARVKMVDQTASLLDFIMSPNDEAFPNDKVEKWNRKAFELVKALAAHYSVLTPLLNLHTTPFFLCHGNCESWLVIPPLFRGVLE